MPVFVRADSAAVDKEGLVAGGDTDQAAGQAPRAEPQQHGGRHAPPGQGVSQVAENDQQWPVVTSESLCQL